MDTNLISLFEEYRTQREELKKMIDSLEEVKKKIDQLFPDVLTTRNKFYFDEKVKTAVALFNSLLEIRKEIIKSLKDEIDLRRKIEIEDRKSEVEDDEIRRIAERMESLVGVSTIIQKDSKQIVGEVLETVQENNI